MSGVGGYVRRSDRRYVPPEPDDGIPRCGHCKARLDIGMVPHICKEVTFGTALSPLATLPIPLTGGASSEPGPPYTHTIVPPEPIGEDEAGNPIYPEPAPAYTLTGDG